MSTTLTPMQEAEDRINMIADAATFVTTAVRDEHDARDARDDFLGALVNALIGQPNPMTEKPHSATSAEKAAKEADEYKAKDKAVLDAECARILAWAGYERAKLTARLAVVAVGGE